jgi:hypothetical protein
LKGRTPREIIALFPGKEAIMASFVITDTLRVDWARINWANLIQYKYRRRSSNGSLLAQEEFDRRRAAGAPAVMWRFDTNDSPPVVVDRCNV